MKPMLSSRRQHYPKRLGIFLFVTALIAGMVGTSCGTSGYDLTMAADPASGGTATDETGGSPYAEGAIVKIKAEAKTGYQFVSWTAPAGTFGNANAASTIFAMPGADVTITASFVEAYDLNIAASPIGGGTGTDLFNASPYAAGTVVSIQAVAAAGYRFVNWTGDVDTIADVEDATTTITMNGDYSITADFRIEIIEIRDWYDLNAIRDNLGGSCVFMNDLDSTTAGYTELASPTANGRKGWQPIEPFSGSFDGQGYEIRDLFIDCPDESAVGLFGYVDEGGVIENVGVVNADVTGDERVGGLVGYKYRGTVSNSYFSGSVTGNQYVGGLVGSNSGTVSNSYSSASVTGEDSVGGLVGWNRRGSDVSNSHYSYDEVLINGKNIITTGALFNEDFEQWLANDKFLDVNERLSQEDGYYVINDVRDFKELLAFGQDDSLKFRLKDDLDLATEPNFYIPYLAGEFDGNGHKIWNLSFNFDFISQVGLFGYLASGGKVTQVAVENLNIAGYQALGGLVGYNHGTLSNSYSTGSVTGELHVGGLVGLNYRGIVSNSYYNYDEVLINGENIITFGALFGEDFEQWLADDKFLDVSQRLSQENGYYVVNNVSDFKQLLAFGQDDSLKFRLKDDLDLATELNIYIPYLAGEFDGNGYKILNLSFDFDFVSQVGLFGYLPSGGEVTQVSVENVNITGAWDVGGLVGLNDGTVSNSYSTGNVSGNEYVGGLVGLNDGTVSNSSAAGDVTGDWVGGLVGVSWNGTVSNSYATGSVTGERWVGGLVGINDESTVSNSHSTGNVTGKEQVGGLLGRNHEGSVTDSYSTGSVTGELHVGGLVGYNTGTVSDSYSSANVTGERQAGGLLGTNERTVNNSYSSGSVTGDKCLGGLVGVNFYGSDVSNSFWDTQTSGQAALDGGTGKTTVEMKSIATFSGAGWNIVAVANPNTRNPAYIWNIVNGQTYPFLSWES